MTSLVRILALCIALGATAAPSPSDATSRGRISGSGEIAEQERAITGFEAVRVGGAIDVRLKPSDRERVTVRADDNLLDLIETTLVPGPIPALQIDLRSGTSLRVRRRPLVTIEFVKLTELTLRGSGNLRAEEIRGDHLAVSIAGSGDIRIDSLEVDALAVMLTGSGDFRAAGRADQQGYRISGAGDVSASSLVGRVVKLGIAGSGDATVHATDTLEVDIAGSGDVRYRGSPRIIQRIAGSGRVRAAR
jgi:hypothetical protein